MEKDYFHVETISQRIKLYDLPAEMNEEQMNELEEIAADKNCDKVIAYVRAGDEQTLEDLSFHMEAEIKGFFQGEDAKVYAKFLDAERNQPDPDNVITQVREMNITSPSSKPLPEGYQMVWGTKAHAEDMAAFYSTIFDTYPTPIDDPEYIVQMMDDDVYFSLIYFGDELVSACSADVFTDFNAAEFTDCATSPDHRGKGLLSRQYPMLERKMNELGVQTMFTYTRAISMGMNIVAAQHGFSFGGCLVQNSMIGTGIEDMNMWYKQL
ncbi:putative beta-lysine N-acetyltransferase [Halobacillus litoralis]|uniref:putative beta-lysine N-acetyltransferase n=1 Tax=Halobacillus litoralis TaxID=45668 RepID=UPI001CD720DC|nr:putative beta-lysine N-acetyltransferase [Halobacillus litoralis]MCA0972423.1 putative beta-lysine N-acetyltransferase [Halobacillus litoralis]